MKLVNCHENEPDLRKIGLMYVFVRYSRTVVVKIQDDGGGGALAVLERSPRPLREGVGRPTPTVAKRFLFLAYSFAAACQVNMFNSLLIGYLDILRFLMYN
jgi:hypothetical protein